jgi:uncharacterized protein involved in outer membrane biogenesis
MDSGGFGPNMLANLMAEPTTPTGSTTRTTLMVAVAAIFVILIVAPVIFVRFFMTAEWIDENVLPEIEARIGRDIEFEHLRLGFRGLELENLHVSEDPAFARTDHPEFASLDNLVLAVEFLPLLQRRVVIGEIVFGDPRIVVHRNADGRFNLSTLTPGGRADAAEADGAGSGSEEAATEAGAAQEARERLAKDGKTRLSIVAEDIRLQNAKVVFIDEAGGGRSKVELRRLVLAAQGVSPDRPFELNATLEVLPGEEAPISVSFDGTVDLSRPFADLDLKIGAIDADALVRVFGRTAQDADKDDRTEAKEARELPFDADLDITVASVTGHGVAAEDLALSLSLQEGKLSIAKGKAGLLGGDVQVSGSVGLEAAEPDYTLQVVLDGLGLVELARLASVDGLRVEDGELDGTLTIVGKGAPDAARLMEGKLLPGEKFLIEGVRLSDARLDWQATSPEQGLRIPELELSLPALYLDRPSELKLKATIAAGASEPGDLEIVGGLDVPKGRIEANVHATSLDLDALTRALAAGSESGTADGQAPAGKSEGAFDLGRWKLEVTADLDRLRAASMEGSALHAAARIGNGKVYVDALAMDLAGGRVDSSGSAEPGSEGLPFDARLDLRNIAIEEMLRPYWQEAWGRLEGTVGMKGSLAGRAADTGSFLGSVDVALDRTSFADAPLMNALATITGVPELRGMTFNNSGGTLRVAGSKLTTERFTLAARHHRLNFVGGVGFDGAIDLEIRVGVSPDAPSQPNISGVARDLLVGRDGWTEIPVAMAGTMHQPLPTIPRRALAEKASEAVPALIEKELGDKIGDKLGPAGSQLLRGLGGLLGGGDKAAP